MQRAFDRRWRPALPDRTRWGRLAWDALWTPFWLGSTLPPPEWPARRRAGEAAPADRVPVIVVQLDALRRTVWRQRVPIVLCRTAWLLLAVAAAWLAFRVFAGPIAPWPFLAAGLVVLALGLALLRLTHPSRGELAYTLDRDHQLRAQVFTAQEEAQGPLLTGVRALQVAAAMRVTDDLAPRISRPRRPVRELRLVAGCALLTLALLLVLNGRGPGTAAGETTDNAGLPLDDQAMLGVDGESPGAAAAGEYSEEYGEPPVGGVADGQSFPEQQDQQYQPDQQDQQSAGSSGPDAQGQHDLDTLADALRDTGVTRDAADKLQSGDYQGATDSLRQAGRDAGQLSPQARRDLANDLRDAANRINDSNLAQRVRDAADAVERGDAQAAQSALDAVAGDIDRAMRGADPPSQDGQGNAPVRTRPGEAPQANRPAQPGDNSGGGGGGSGSSPALPGQQRAGPAYGPSTAPLGADEKPVKLPKGDQRGATVRGSGGGSRGATSANPNSAGTGDGKLQQGEIGEVGPEINRVPVDQRGAVERYFTPNPEKREQAP